MCWLALLLVHAFIFGQLCNIFDTVYDARTVIRDLGRLVAEIESSQPADDTADFGTGPRPHRARMPVPVLNIVIHS